MRDNGIQDIEINNNFDSSNRKGKKIIIIVFIILLIILIGLYFAYKYYIKNEEISKKQLFFKGFESTNIEEVFDTDIYKSIYKRFLSENCEIKNSIKYSSSRDDNLFNEFDLIKFDLKANTNTDIENNKMYSEININYSDNELLKLKILSDKNKIGIMSDEIVSKYIGLDYTNFSDILGIDYNKNILSALKNKKEIELTDDEKKDYISKYVKVISNSIPEENFSIQDNIAINKGSKNVSVIAYKVVLTQDELKDTLLEVVTELKKDEEFLNKIFVEEKEDLDIDVKPLNTLKETNNIDVLQQDNMQQGQQNVMQSEEQLQQGEEQVSQNIEENNGNISNVFEQNINPEQGEIQNIIASILPYDSEINFGELQSEENVNLKELVSKYKNSNVNYNLVLDITNLFLGNKINHSVKSIQNKLDSLINKIEKLEGNGLTLIVYVSDDGTEKINAILPNGNTLDVELLKEDNENGVKLTYLYSNKMEDENLEDNARVYSSKDQFNEENNNNGFSIECSRQKKDVKNAIKFVYNFIENSSINKKITIDLETTGNNNSRNISNDFIVTINDEKEDKFVLENNIVYGESKDIDQLQTDNCLLLNNLSEDNFNLIIKTINIQMKNFIEKKKDELNLIETNTQRNIIRNNSNSLISNITREEARNILIEKVSQMMKDAQDKGEEFSIQNLSDLKIDDYNVSSTVNEESATITIDIYTFKINTNFELTDAN